MFYPLANWYISYSSHSKSCVQRNTFNFVHTLWHIDLFCKQGKARQNLYRSIHFAWKNVALGVHFWCTLFSTPSNSNISTGFCAWGCKLCLGMQTRHGSEWVSYLIHRDLLRIKLTVSLENFRIWVFLDADPWKFQLWHPLFPLSSPLPPPSDLPPRLQLALSLQVSSPEYTWFHCLHQENSQII